MVARFVVVALLVAGTADAAPLKIEDAIARAASRGKPLVVYFGAAWCAPCKLIERDVLPRGDVRKALAGIELVHYEIDVSPGDAAAQRYRVTSVPAFVVIGSDGSEVRRKSGASTADRTARMLIELLTHARDRQPTSTDLEAAAAANPGDPQPRLRLARHYVAVGRRTDAIAAFRAALPNVDRSVAAETTATIDDLVAAEARVQAALESAAAFAAAFPESPLASPRLALLATSNRMPRAKLADLVNAHLDAIPANHLAQAIRVAVLAGSLADARLAVTRAEPREQSFLDAELALTHEPARAKQRIEKLCTEPPAGYEHRCFALAAALRAHHSPGLAALAQQARDTLDSLENPSARNRMDELAALGEQHRDLGNEIARAITEARRQCGEVAIKPTRAIVRFELASGGGTSVHVETQLDQKGLSKCLQQQLTRKWPDAKGVGDLWAIVDVERVAVTPRKPRGDKLVESMLVFGTARAGSFENAGVGAHVIAQAVGLVMLSGELEVGGLESPSYVLRGMAGLEMRPDRVTVSFSSGVAATRFGNEVPSAIDIPLELRVRVPIGPVRAHAWTRLSIVQSDGPRDKTAPWDKLAGGIGASVPIFGQRVMFGAAIEDRAMGTNALFTVGLPIRSYF